MDKLIEKAQFISDKFILSEFGYANLELTKFAEMLMVCKTQIPQNELLKILEQIVRAQEDKNYIYVADILLYRLIPLLKS